MTVKKVLICALAASMLALPSCNNTQQQTDPKDTEAVSVTQESETLSASDKLAPSISESPEFKAGNTVRNIRVYFDSTSVNESIQKHFPDEAALIAYKTEHGLEGTNDLRKAIYAEEIESTITSILGDHSISVKGDEAQFGAASAHLTLTAIGCDELASLSRDERVVKIVPFDPSSAITLGEAEIEKIENEQHNEFDQMLAEAMPDDMFDVCILFDFLVDSEHDLPIAEREALIEKRFTEFLDNKKITVGDSVERGADSLVGEMSAADIAKLLEANEVVSVWLKETLIEGPWICVAPNF